MANVEKVKGGWSVTLENGNTATFTKTWYQAGLKSPNLNMFAPPGTAQREAFEAITAFKLQQDDDDVPGAGGGRLIPAGLNLHGATGPTPGSRMDHPSSSASSYTWGTAGGSGAQTITIKPNGKTKLRDLRFSSSQADTLLQSASVGDVTVFSAGQSTNTASAGGILLSELTSANNRRGFLAGHQIGPDDALVLTLNAPTSAQIRATAEHDFLPSNNCPR